MNLRCINVSTPSCALLIAFTLLLVAPQLKLVKSLHGSTFQFDRETILIVICLFYKSQKDGNVTACFTVFNEIFKHGVLTDKRVYCIRVLLIPSVSIRN